MVQKLIFFIVIIFPSTICYSAYSVKVSPDKSIWMTESKAPFTCKLGQYVDMMGEVFIVAEAGIKPYIDYELPGYSSFTGIGDIFVVATDWSQSGEDYILSSTYKTTDYGVRFMITKPLPTILNNMISGMALKMQMSDVNQPISVELSSVNIGDAVVSFRECLRELLPVNYHQISNIDFYYPEQHFKLNERQKKKVRDIVRYIKADDKILGISIDTHTDNGGDRLNNLMLSRRRKEEIIRYFSETGLDPSYIKVNRHHGQRYPAFKNSTEDERAKNRRADIKVFRENEYGRLEPNQNEIFLKFLNDKKNASAGPSNELQANKTLEQSSEISPSTENSATSSAEVDDANISNNAAAVNVKGDSQSENQSQDKSVSQPVTKNSTSN